MSRRVFGVEHQALGEKQAEGGNSAGARNWCHVTGTGSGAGEVGGNSGALGSSQICNVACVIFMNFFCM